MKRLNEKDFLVLANKINKKSMKNIPDCRNAKEHYQSFITQKNRKSVEQS